MSFCDLITRVEYREVAGFEGYVVEIAGWVWSMRFTRGPLMWRFSDVPQTRLKPGTGTKGHRYVNLHRDGKQHCRYVHHLILEAFVGPCPNGMEACHNDGNPSNNALSNLRWDTPKSNNADKLAHGTLLFGSAMPHAKLNEAKVAEIKALDKMGLSRREIGARFGIGPNYVGSIVRGKRWVHT